MNQGFMPSLQHKIRSDYINYKISEAPPPPATQKLASVELLLLQLEQIASTLPPPQTVVASLQGVSKVDVKPQYINATNPDLQQLNQRH